MEGNNVTYKRLAYQEYQNSKDKARYVALAQKLAQHINNLSEDKNSRIRWLWELIQNAKDVPNQFGKCRIRIEVRNDKLIFAHNGDPFRVSDLQSLVAQYSSKPEENKIQAQTTGKYGTGFIVTYILSRKIRIKGLLSVKTKEELESNSKGAKEEEDVNVELVSQDQIRNSKSTISSVKSKGKYEQNEETLNQSMNIEQEVQQTMPKKSKMKGFEGGSLFQRFQIYLDRQYKDRDSELFHKLRQTELNLLDDLLKNQPQPKWQRKQTQLNTQFIYEDLDEAALKMIDEAMKALKQLFPYALLFNPKLFQIQMIDKREGKRLKNFGIKRIQEEKYNGVTIFNANILEEGSKKPRKFSLAYMEDQETYSTIAMPLLFEQNNIQLLQVNSKYPKIFKQFPLIGCKDTGFNFVFTSRKFYPNESRSGLMLSHIQGRNTSQKSNSNWKAVQGVFNKGLQLYKQVSKMITSGQQNLLIISLQNQFTLQQFADKKMSAMFRRYQKEISEIKFLQFKNGSKGMLCDLVFPCGKSSNPKIMNSEYSLKLNSIFSSIIGESKTFDDIWFEKFYQKFDIYDATWSSFVQFYDFNQCLMKLSQLTFIQLIYKTGGEKKLAFELLEKLYSFLLENNPLSVTQNIKEPNSINFVLTNKEEFRNLSETTFGKMLMVKKDLPSSYEEIALYLGINIEEYTIHDRFTKYFLKVKIFGVEEMLGRFQYIFFNNLSDPNSLILLGRFMTTFKIQTDGMQIAIKLKSLIGVNVSLPLNNKDAKLNLDKKRMMEYKYLFQMKLLKYINQLINENEKLVRLMDYTIFLSNETDKCIDWLNEIYKLEKALISKQQEPQFKRCKITVFKKNTNSFFQSQPTTTGYFIDKNLTLSNKFKPENTLKCFCFVQQQKFYKGNYPNQKDIQFYERIRGIAIRTGRGVTPLEIKQSIQHQKIKYKLSTATTFSQTFQWIVEFYNRTGLYYNYVLSNDDKICVLNYIYSLREQAVKNRDVQFKLQVFKSIEMKAYHEYPLLTNCIKIEQNKIYAFSLIRDEKELAAAREICQRFGGLNAALIELKKMEKQKEKEKEKEKTKEKQNEREKEKETEKQKEKEKVKEKEKYQQKEQVKKKEQDLWLDDQSD